MVRLCSLAFALLTLCAAPCMADDAAIDEALRDLGADEVQLRDAAGKVLWAADGSAWKRASEVLEKTKDAEVRARLAPIVDWLWMQLKCERLETIWKDRWFLVKSGGRIVGVEHQTALLAPDGAGRAWTFVHEADELEADGKTRHKSLRIRARHDPSLAPLDAKWCSDWHLDGEDRQFTWEGSRVRVCPDPALERAHFGPSYGTCSKPLQLAADETYTVDVLVPERIECASLSRIDRLEFPAHFMFSDSETECHAYKAQFKDLRRIEAFGAQVEARVYVHASDEAGSRAEYWISDAEGLLRIVIDGFEYVRVSEEEARAAGLDRESRRALEGTERVNRLLGAEGTEARNVAELDVLAYAESLGPARKALAAASDPDLRARLRRCTNWLDPEFATDALARFRGERFFKAEHDGKCVGAERFAAERSDAKDQPGWTWNGEASTAQGERLILASWSAATGPDPMLAPRDASFNRVDPEGRTSMWSARWSDRGFWPWITESRGNKFDGSHGGSLGGLRSRRSGSSLPATLQVCVSHQVERASLARLPAIALSSFRFSHENPRFHLLHFVEFAGEETLNIAGRSVAVRHYVHPREPSEGRVEYWVSDEEGLVRTKRDDVVETVISREEWLASGFDSDSARRKITALRVRALCSEDPAVSAEAMAQLEGEPDNLPALRTALEVEQNELARRRLESLCRWLDPEFGRAEMEALGKVRWFEALAECKPIGWEKVSASRDAAGWDFQVFVHGPTGEAGLVPRETSFHTDRFAAGRRYEIEDRLDPVIRDMHARLTLDHGAITWLSVELDGEGPMEGAGPQRLAGGREVPIVPKALLPRFLERASLARLDSLTVAAWETLQDEWVSVRRFDFQAEETLEIDGKQTTARRYSLIQPGAEHPAQYWITDAAGVIRRLEDGIEYRATTESALKK